MKHILFLLLFLCPALAFAQWPAAPNKMRLGNQTTGDGLVVRTAAAPAWTPSTINNAWLAFDTVAAVFYYYDAGTWNTFSGGGTLANNGLTMSGDTVQLGGTLTKTTTINTDGKTFRIQDAGAYPDLFMNSTFGQIASDINTYLDVGSVSGRARIVAAATAQLTSAGNTNVSATDTVTVTGQRIRLNAADTRIQQVAKDNALNRLMALDSLTGQLKYVDKSSISGGGGTVTGSGTTGTIPVWSSSTALGDSPLTVTSGNVTATGTGMFRLPSGTTAQQPGTPSAGMTRYNTSNGALEYYGASAWEAPVKSDNGTGLGIANYVSFYDANGRLSAGNAGLRFFTSPYNYMQYGQNTTLTDNTIFFWLNGNSDSRRITNSSGATRSNETGAWRVVAEAAGAHTYYNFNIATIIGLTSSTIPAGGVYRALRAEMNISNTAGASEVNGVEGRASNGSEGTTTSLNAGVFSVRSAAGGTVTNARGLYVGDLINSAGGTLTNTYGVHVGDITTGTQTNTARSFYAEDGNAINVFNGSTMLGATSAPSRTLHVTGEARITDLTTDTPTRIVGADADGDLGQMTLGGNLTITSGILSADNTNLTLADEGNGVRILSSTGTDVDLLEDSGIYITRSGNIAYFGKYMAYGEASITGSQTLTFAGGSTSYDTLSGYTQQAVDGFVLQGGALKYTGTRTIQVRVEVSISLTFAEAADVLAGIRQNTTSITKSRARQKIATAGDINNISLTCLLTLAPDDLIRIELAPSAHTGDDDITVYHCNFNISEL